MMDKTKREILKSSMSVKYYGETRFDFLDPEERPLIYDAMNVYAKQEALSFANWLSNQVVDGRTITKLWYDYQKEFQTV